MKATLTKSDKAKFKFKVELNGKKIYFGAKGYSDYTIHKNDERKTRYLARHSANENWRDKYSKGFWSRWILWNKKILC